MRWLRSLLAVAARLAGRLAGRPATEPAGDGAGAPAGVPPRPPSKRVRPPSRTSLPAILLALVNRERLTAGQCRCEPDHRLAAVAQSHSERMAAAGLCLHALPDGSGDGAGPDDRVAAAGYAWADLWEDVSAGPDTALDMVAAWAADPHRKPALLAAGCQHAGFGLAVARDGTHYWTVLLARPADGGSGGGQLHLSGPPGAGGAS